MNMEGQFQESGLDGLQDYTLPATQPHQGYMGLEWLRATGSSMH